ncbi:MAG: BREX-1 system adenine-specific DNA-methyltransferase PglX [Pseudomonadota bacterium]
MNTGNIKKYAPKARTRFIETMTRQAARYGISAGHKGEGHVAPAEVRGDVMLISALDGQTHSFPKALRGPREALAKWVTQLGFEQAMEQAAYSWFNRLCAIRFMELKGYLDHGRRVLSHPDHEGGLQILDDCLEIDLSALDKSLDTARVRELKLDGTQDEVLYRELLLAQCHALHEAMPFLFEPLDDASELLLPDNLTKTDSLIRELVEAIPEEDWQDVEVIGWLYQFYIAEKKDQVIGKVVKSEDIPAATQLFTPNWIVQYLVQNSVGRQWLQTYPDSPLKGEMPYYIEPAEQEPEVQAQLDAITPASIDPETIKVLDPACGSGHILVEAYNVLKAIYEERGYRSRDIPKLVLENNLFGLDIDDRAAQLAGFALLMKAREDDRRIFTRGVRLNVMALQSTQHLDAGTLWRDLNLTGDWHQGQSQSLFESEQKPLSSNDNTYKAIVDLIERFQDAKTFGSLIEVPNSFEAPLKTLLDELIELAYSGDIIQKTAARQLKPIVQQAWALAQRYDAVIANPPYMGSKGMNKALKDFAKKSYPNSKSDLFAIFMEHAFSLLAPLGYNAQINMQSWMFLSAFSKLRYSVLSNNSVQCFIHVGYNSFPEMNSKVAQACAFVIRRERVINSKALYTGLNSLSPSSDKLKGFKNRGVEFDHIVTQESLLSVPGNPIAFWITESERKAFREFELNSKKCITSNGIQTGNNEKYVRQWWEVNYSGIGKKWVLYNKGGPYRKWYGNVSNVVNWENDGERIKNEKNSGVGPAHLLSRESLTWTDVTWRLSGRFLPNKVLSDHAGPCAYFYNEEDLFSALSVVNTPLADEWSKVLNTTLHFQAGDYKKLPFPPSNCRNLLAKSSKNLVEVSKRDWDSKEVSADFFHPERFFLSQTLTGSYNSFVEKSNELTQLVHEAEREILKKVMEAFSINDRPTLDVERELISLECNPVYCYTSGNIDEKWKRFCSDYNYELISYCMGCLLGRYSLDKPGLILASQGETVRDYLAQIPEPSFAPDQNAIIPLTDQEWFPDDATNRFRDFVRTVWGEEHLQENLDFVANSLCLHAIKPKKGEAALETIRRYLSTQFYKDHLRTYKKRPIYWLFSSGKQKAFECLVYLHRYNESTLAEMRTDYVIPLTTKLGSYVEKLEQDKEASASAAEAKRIEKDLSKLYKQQAELNAFDEKLRHYADQRISLDLDDGVKVNYGKFGDLLAEVKAVTGEKAE